MKWNLNWRISAEAFFWYHLIENELLRQLSSKFYFLLKPHANNSPPHHPCWLQPLPGSHMTGTNKFCSRTIISAFVASDQHFFTHSKTLIKAKHYFSKLSAPLLLTSVRPHQTRTPSLTLSFFWTASVITIYFFLLIANHKKSVVLQSKSIAFSLRICLSHILYFHTPH